MKPGVLFVLLFALISQGNSKKVCMLFEQRRDPIATILDRPESVVPMEKVLNIEGATENVTHSISILSNDTNSKSTNVCALEAITLFDDQNDILRRLCGLSASMSLNIVTVQNDVVKSDSSLSTLCTEGARGLVSWIPWQDFIEKVRPLLSADDIPQLVVRNSSIAGASEAGSVDSFSEVLIEMLPIKYKLVNMKRSAWNNNTFIKTVSLGNTTLENSNEEDSHIEGEISYSFPIESNITFLSNFPINGLPVEMSDELDDRTNFLVGSSNSYIFNDTFSFERLVPAFQTEHISLKGTYGIHEYQIEGKIVSVFGTNTDGSTIEESHFISARVVSLEIYDIKESFNLETTTEENKPTSFEELPIAIPKVNEPLYPEFRKFFYIALILILATVCITFIDITRKLISDRNANTKGRRTYQMIIPKL